MSSAVGRASVVMAGGTLTSRVLGVVRTSMLAGLLGTTAASAEAFEVANTLPNQFYYLLAGGILNAVLVPQIVKARAHEDGGEDFLSRVITVSVALVVAAAVAATLAAPLLVRIFSDFTSPDTYHLAVVFAWICLPQILFYGLYTLLGQILNAHGRFGAYMWAPVVANVVAILGIVAYRLLGYPERPAADAWTPGMYAAIAGSATLSIALQAACLLIPLRKLGLHLRPRWGIRGFGLGSAGTVAWWTFAAVAVSQLGFAVTSRVLTHAQDLGKIAGQPSAGRATFGPAYLVAMLPHSLVTVSLVTALFTRMSAAAHSGDREAFLGDVRTGLRTPAVLLVPATALGVAFAPYVTAVLFPQNTPAETSGLAQVVVTLLLGVVPFGWIYVNERAFYAHEDARTPFRLQLVTTGVAVVGSLLAGRAAFSDTAWLVGLGQSVAYAVSALVGFALVRRRFGSLGARALLGLLVRLAVPAVVAAVALRRLADLVLPDPHPGRLVTAAVLALAGITGLALSLLGARLLGVREIDALVAPVRRRLGRV